MPEIFMQDIIRPALVCRPFLDAVICDPPYGLKVRSRKAMDDNQATNKSKFDKNLVYHKLIELARTQLLQGRRIVFFYHTDSKRDNEQDNVDFLDSMQCQDGFQLIDISSCEFLKRRKRHMVTLQKL